MKVKKQIVFLLSSVLLLFFFSEILIAQNQIPVSVLGSGGAEQSNDSYSLTGTLGQTFIGSCSSPTNQLQNGFWFTLQTVTSSAQDEFLPIEYKLEQNYPNPFNPSTVIKFAVSERCNVLIKIYEIIGSELITLVNEEMQPGWHSRTFNAAGFASGIYIFRMEAGSYISTKKMLLLK